MSCSTIAAICAGAVLIVSGCAGRTDLEVLEKNQFTLRNMIASDRQQIEQLREEVRRLNDELVQQERGGAPSGGGAPAVDERRLAAIESRLSRLEGPPAGPVSNAPAPPPAAVAPAVPPAPAAPPPAAAAPPPAASPIAPSGPAQWTQLTDKELARVEGSSAKSAKLYVEGLKAMQARKYAAAEQKFAQLQRKFPRSELCEPGQFFSANALYESAKYDQAILQFNDLVMRYPKGRFASAALLREAQAFEKLNDRIDARLTVQKLLADYPNAPEVVAAKSMMKKFE